VQLDGRFTRPKIEYSYTLSLWIKTRADIPTESNPYVAKYGPNILKLEEVFVLYMSHKTEAKFFFQALKNYYESTSYGFFVPLDQWINIQMVMSQYDGYEIRVYDSNGDMISHISEDKNLQEQRPNGMLYLF